MSARPRLRIAGSKIVDYLLNIEHAEGGAKARFFLSFGFSADQPRDFADALFRQASEQNLVRRQDGLWGRKLIYEGPLPTPDARNPTIRTIWQIARADPDRADLISAYPIG